MSFGHNNPPVGLERPLYAALRGINAGLSFVLRVLGR